MKRTAAISGVLILASFYPPAAEAHLVTSGLGPFYDGALHLLLSPEDLLGLLAAAALAGLHSARAGRMAVATLSVTWFTASLVGLNLADPLEIPWLNVGSMVILGGLVAVNPTMPPMAVAALAGFYGVLHGLLNGSALAAVDAGPLALAGVSATVLIVGLLSSAYIVSLRAAWARIAVRVAGSWIAAVGMLMLGWLVRGPG